MVCPSDFCFPTFPSELILVFAHCMCYGGLFSLRTFPLFLCRLQSSSDGSFWMFPFRFFPFRRFPPDFSLPTPPFRVSPSNFRFPTLPFQLRPCDLSLPTFPIRITLGVDSLHLFWWFVLMAYLPAFPLSFAIVFRRENQENQ